MIPRLLQALVPIRNDGGGNHYCPDTRHLQDDECPVVFWDHEEGATQTPEQVAVNFTAWLTDELDAREQ
jgi:hypothetical protein